MKKITLVVYTYNNEKEIKEIIENGKKLTNEIIIIDLESQDKTSLLAKQYGAEVFVFPHTPYVEPAREYGIRKAKSDWVLILDADERIDERLVEEINTIFHQSGYRENRENEKKTSGVNLYHLGGVNAISHFRIPRKNIFIKKWLRHGGWWPDYQIRLINKNYLVSWPKEIHSTPIIKGKCGYLDNPLLHYFHGNLEEMVKKTIKFEDIESDLLLKANRQVSTLTFFRKFLGEFWRRMLLKMGFLDGVFGIIESIYQAFSKTITYLYLYEKRNFKKSGSL